MSTVNVFQAKSTLSKLIERVESGKDIEIIIARHGRPVARLTRLEVARPEMRVGVAKGRFTVPDSIDADNVAVAKLFRGGRG
jgi:prevent-host-death family protein